MTSTPASTPPATPATPAMDRFFDALRRSSVVRPQERVVAGVSAGIAARLGIAPAVVRVGAVVLGILGPGVVLYLAAWLLLPRYDGQVRLERAVRGGDAASIVLLVATLLSFLPDVLGRWHLGPWPIIALAVLAVVGLKKGWFGPRGSGHGTGHGTWGHATTSTTPAPPTGPTPPTTPATPPSGPQDAPRV